jgi:hypothetical protein
MKTIFLILLLASTSFALNINDSLLKIHATLIPKVYLMDYNFKKNLQNNTIIIAILYEHGEYRSAKSLKEKIEFRYPKGINSYTIVPKLVPYKEVSKCKANIFYMLPTSKRMIQKSVAHAQKKHALTFSYDKKDLNYGVMISLNVSKKIKPILNLEAIKLNHIQMRPILIKISQIFTYNVNNLLERIQKESLNFIKVYNA